MWAMRRPMRVSHSPSHRFRLLRWRTGGGAAHLPWSRVVGERSKSMSRRASSGLCSGYRRMGTAPPHEPLAARRAQLTKPRRLTGRWDSWSLGSIRGMSQTRRQLGGPSVLASGARPKRTRAHKQPRAKSRGLIMSARMRAGICERLQVASPAFPRLHIRTRQLNHHVKSPT